ncbi:MAG TPA: arginine deiminase-related protein [Flavitalea sp.]|nr:arginine deiminase-related protein [Flavitalea sp.]
MQTTSHILMIRPVNFVFNKQTAVNNSFQLYSDEVAVQEHAIAEFDNFVEKLRSNKIDVIVVKDTTEPHTPDSIFPNNWISFHQDGTVVLYPMFAENRRLERKMNVVEEIRSKFMISNTIDLSTYEQQQKYLEGTGSIVPDREKRIAYACVSPRTDEQLFIQFCNLMNYEPVMFHANDTKGLAIYHTNVMMCVADQYIVICLECITDETEKDRLIVTINRSGKKIIDISLDQMNHFAGNMLQVNNADGEKFLVMSEQAYRSLTQKQINDLKKFNEIIYASLNTIEKNGGGSARCMMAEVYLPLRPNSSLSPS